MSKIRLQPEHGSDVGSFPEPKYKSCTVCEGEGHHDGHACYHCEGSGAVEMDADELQMDHESRMEEGNEY